MLSDSQQLWAVYRWLKHLKQLYKNIEESNKMSNKTSPGGMMNSRPMYDVLFIYLLANIVSLCSLV